MSANLRPDPSAIAVDNEAYGLAGKRVWVAGHRGMVGSAIVRRLASEGCELVLAERKELDLTRQADVAAWMKDCRPQAVFLAAARVGGIAANDTFPATFLHDNLLMAANILHGAWSSGVEKLLFLGSSCIYPRHAPQPIRESALLTGPLEATNEAYAVAKIAGVKLCQAYRKQHGCDFISTMPCNLYGPGDNFDLESSHVVPALLRKAHEAKRGGLAEMKVWGTGRARREFLFVDDCAEALVRLMQAYSDPTPVNVGSGSDLTIRELAVLVADIVGFKGRIVMDPSKPDGTPRKLLATTRLRNLGWKPRTTLEDGLEQTYRWYLASLAGDACP